MQLTRRAMMIRLLHTLAALGAARYAPGAQAKAKAQIQAGEPDTLENALLRADFSTGMLLHKPTGFRTGLPFGLRLEMADGARIRPEDGERIGTHRWRMRDGALAIEVIPELAEGNAWLRSHVRIHALKADQPIRRVVLCDTVIDGARVSGEVRGCPLITDRLFAAIEHPLGEHRIEQGRALAFMPQSLPLRAGQSLHYTFTVGLAAPGQLRRAFATYLEEVRAHPYRPFLHYNSWYDIGFADHPYSEADMLAVIDAFAAQDLPLQSFLHDDGWDDPATLWHFHDGFDNGLARIADKARAMGAAPGIWLSPWGGYGNEKTARMATGRALGFAMNEDGFALSGPRYFDYFRKRCLELIARYGVNQFKLDGLGNADRVVEGSRFNSDFDAAIQLIRDLRAAKPDLYVNLTYGTFPSPFWLLHADSIWRGGKDHDFAGEGTRRQQWITYRDADTYAGVVQQSDLFPLHSLMLHGIIFAPHTRHLAADPFGDFGDEVRSFFASGTQCQELYVSPALLKPRHWEALHEGTAFSARFAHLLQDNRWIGGDPAAGEIYGWAAWRGGEGLLSLRNPSPKPQRFTLDLPALWELPPDAPPDYTDYTLRDGWNGEAISPEDGTITLQPFELRSLHGVAERRVSECVVRAGPV